MVFGSLRGIIGSHSYPPLFRKKLAVDCGSLVSVNHGSLISSRPSLIRPVAGMLWMVPDVAGLKFKPSRNTKAPMQAAKNGATPSCACSCVFALKSVGDSFPLGSFPQGSQCVQRVKRCDLNFSAPRIKSTKTSFCPMPLGLTVEYRDRVVQDLQSLRLLSTEAIETVNANTLTRNWYRVIERKYQCSVMALWTG